MSSWERAMIVNWDPTGIYRCTKPLDIQLKRRTAKGIAFYEFRFKNGESIDEWDSCWLVPRGTLRCVWQSAPLPPWDPAYQDDYDRGIRRQLASMDMSTRRLEGELDFGDTTKIVYLFAVHRAIRDPATRKFSDLLIIQTASNFPWNASTVLSDETPAPAQATGLPEDDGFGDDGTPIDDGTAHGNPK